MTLQLPLPLPPQPLQPPAVLLELPGLPLLPALAGRPALAGLEAPPMALEPVNDEVEDHHEDHLDADEYAPRRSPIA